MDQLSSLSAPAKQAVTLAHEHVSSLGLEPIPTVILVVALALVGVIALVARGGNRRPRGAHRA